MLQREICCAVCPSTTPYPAVTLCCSNLGTKDSRWLCEHGVLQVLQLTNREIPPPLLRLRRKLSDIYSGQTLYYWKLCQYFCVKLMMNVPPSLPSLPPPLPPYPPSYPVVGKGRREHRQGGDWVGRSASPTTQTQTKAQWHILRTTSRNTLYEAEIGKTNRTFYYCKLSQYFLCQVNDECKK